MITIAMQLHQDVNVQEKARFLEMLPRIRRPARLAFRRLRRERKDERVQEVLGNAYRKMVPVSLREMRPPAWMLRGSSMR
jgi:hypothetical protein